MSSGSVCMESAVRTHVKIMQSTCGLVQTSIDLLDL